MCKSYALFKVCLVASLQIQYLWGKNQEVQSYIPSVIINPCDRVSISFLMKKRLILPNTVLSTRDSIHLNCIGPVKLDDGVLGGWLEYYRNMHAGYSRKIQKTTKILFRLII